MSYWVILQVGGCDTHDYYEPWVRKLYTSREQCVSLVTPLIEREMENTSLNMSMSYADFTKPLTLFDDGERLGYKGEWRHKDGDGRINEESNDLFHIVEFEVSG